MTLVWLFWVEFWCAVLRPEIPQPEHSADVVDLAQWRREHPADLGGAGPAGWAA